MEKETSRLGTRLAENNQESKKADEGLSDRIGRNARDIKDIMGMLGREKTPVPAATGDRDKDLENLANMLADL